MDYITSGWLLFNTAVGGAVGFYLFSNWKTLDVPKKILSIFAIFVPLHQIEEYALPGGFSYIYNLESASLTPLSAMVTNTVALLLIVLVLWKFADKTWALMFAAIFAFGQLATHFSEAQTSLEHFGSAGQTLLYAPGFFTSVVLLVPLAIFSIVYLVRQRSSLLINAKNTFKHIGIALLATLVIVGGTILIPQLIFSGTTQEFGFAGYYERFLN